MSWFEVDRKGLAQILERRGKEFAVFEVISNAWDTDATEVNVSFEPWSKNRVKLIVEDDDPNGFTDLAHAFTLFAPSEKKDKSDKRGRFNLGEKLVLAICEEAVISSTKGTITFDAKGRHKSSKTTERGSRIDCLLRMTKTEYADALRAAYTLIPPVRTTINGALLTAPTHVTTFACELPTEKADADGNLKRARAKAMVIVYEPRKGEKAQLYEMGVPVVETDDRWHVNVKQKIPLNMDRDNVPPSFLREIRTEVLNELYTKLNDSDANQPWVREATSDKDCSPDATETVMTLRFGKNRVAYDPSDPEANSLAVSKGFTVVHGGMMNATEWANAKAAAAILPAGQVTPSPKPFSETGEHLKVVDVKDYTPGMHTIVAYTIALGVKLMNKAVFVHIANDIKWPFAAAYGNGQLTFNLGRLGHAFFDGGPSFEVNRLLIHEFGHEYESDHLSEKYHEALCKLGAKLAQLALDKPGLFHDFMPPPP